MSTPILFYQLSISMILYQRAKNQPISSICFIDIVDLKILQTDWSGASWPISQESPDISKIWHLCRNAAYNINFIRDRIQKKLMTKFYNKLKKPYFWSISGPFPPFFGQNYFFQNCGSVIHNTKCAPNRMLSFIKKIMSQL